MTDNVIYRIYPRYWDTLLPYHTCSKSWTCPVCYLLICVETAWWVTNRVDPDQMPHSLVSDLGLFAQACLSQYLGLLRNLGYHSLLKHASQKRHFFTPKILIFFLFLHENICCGYSLEVLQWGSSNEYPQHIVLWRNRKKYEVDTHSYLDLCHIKSWNCLFILSHYNS